MCGNGEARKPWQKIGYMPQTETVDWTFPVTVDDVVMMGRYPRLGFLRRPGRHDRAAVPEALAEGKMLDHRDTQIGQLPGGSGSSSHGRSARSPIFCCSMSRLAVSMPSPSTRFSNSWSSSAPRARP